MTQVTVQDIKNNSGASIGSIIRWNDLTDNDEGAWIEMLGSRGVVQVVRTLEGAEAPIGRFVIEGRNADDVEGMVLNSKRNTKMNFNNSAIEEFNEMPRYIRPRADGIKNGKFSVIIMITL